jgi:hypothetical protein
MPVFVIRCGPTANHSEELAIERCKASLESLKDAERWVVLANLAFSATPLRQSDDLDLVCVGPRGVILIEVKHWDAGWVKDNQPKADVEAHKLTAKARRLGGLAFGRIAHLRRGFKAMLLRRMNDVTFNFEHSLRAHRSEHIKATLQGSSIPGIRSASKIDESRPTSRR